MGLSLNSKKKAKIVKGSFEIGIKNVSWHYIVNKEILGIIRNKGNAFFWSRFKSKKYKSWKPKIYEDTELIFLDKVGKVSKPISTGISDDFKTAKDKILEGWSHSG